MPFAFTPTDGYRNTTTFPTTPASETAFRDSMQSLLDQLRDELNSGSSSAGGIGNMSRQAIINGNMDIWQRGTSFANPTNGQFTADRFLLAYSSTGTLPTTITHSRQQLTSGDILGAYWYYRINTNGAGSGFGVNDHYTFFQKIENGTSRLCGNGKKITVSFYAKSDIAGKKLGVNAAQAYGTGGSPSASDVLVGQIVTLTTTWTKYTVTLTTSTLVGKTFGTNNDDLININLSIMYGSTTGTTRFGSATSETFVGSGNIDIAQVQVCAGDSALPFQPRSFGEELELCERYYTKTFSYATVPANGTGSYLGALASKAQTSVNEPLANWRFPVKMRTTPTITTYNPRTSGSSGQWGSATTDSSFARSYYASEVSVNLDNTGTTLATDTWFIHATADAEL